MSVIIRKFINEVVMVKTTSPIDNSRKKSYLFKIKMRDKLPE